MSSRTAGTANGPGDGTLAADAIAYASGRGVSRRTLELLGATSGTVKGVRSVIFPYYQGDRLTFWKAAGFPEKRFSAMPGGEQSFFNLQNAIADLKSGKTDALYITEGEWDAASLVEAGLHGVVSVPSGARQKPSEDDTPAGYDYVFEAMQALPHSLKRIVWCGDNDGPGHALRQDMAKLWGPARFYYVDWPDGIKDANDYLIDLEGGPQALREIVTQGALPWPVSGLYRMAELPEPAPMTLWDPGFPEWQGKVMLAPRTLSVVTGHPGHGKTSLFAQIWYQVARKYDVVVCAASFETRAKPHMRRMLRQMYSNQPEAMMSPVVQAEADAWINAHYMWAIHDEDRPNLDWLLDTAEVAVVRHGARVVQIDPWNRLEASRPGGESETDYIGRCLRAVYRFATDLNVHVQILAHPAKMGDIRRGRAPLLEDISGSKNWDNMVDQGFVVHRDKVYDEESDRRCTEALLIQRKARFEELGYPCQLELNYDLGQRKYVSIDYETRTQRALR